MSGEAFGIPVSNSLCDDCDAEHRLVETRPGVWALEIRHDDTCPSYRAMNERSV